MLQERKQVIYKYTLGIRDEKQTVRLPRNSSFLSVINQRNSPTLYFLVDPEEPQTERVFQIFPTGLVVSERALLGMIFRGTIQTHTGEFVWHIFEERSL